MPPDMLRSSVFHRCQWVSTRPGATIIPRASSSRAPARVQAGPDRGDAAASHQDVTLGEVAERRVHGHHVAGADDHVLAQHAVMVLRTGARMVGMAHG